MNGDVKILLSIIIPYYGKYRVLRRLLDSIKEHEAVQIIVIDDCSEEKNEEVILREYPFVQYIRTAENRGAGACRNVGLSLAEGQWVLFADADDFFVENYWEILGKYWKSEKDIIYFCPTSIFEDSGQIADRHIEYDRMMKACKKEWTHENENNVRYRLASPCSKLVRREMISKNGIWFEEVRVSNDLLFSVKCGYFAREIDIETEVVYCITKNKGSLTTKRDYETTYIRLQQYIKAYLFLKERLNPRELRSLEWRGGAFLVKALQNKYSLKQFVTLIGMTVKNRLPIWDRQFLKKICNLVKQEKLDEKYKA